MANLVTYRARPDLAPFSMSNGMTSVFIAVLTLAASDLAVTDHEREFAVWFASFDQARVGNGVADFDVSEMPWSSATFDADKDFVSRTIAAAREKSGWSRLAYAPHEPWVRQCLDELQVLVAAFSIEHAAPATEVWTYGRKALRPMGFVLCPTHKVYEHADGCVLCHDEA